MAGERVSNNFVILFKFGAGSQESTSKTTTKPHILNVVCNNKEEH